MLSRFTNKKVDREWLNTNFPCMMACPAHTNAGRYVTLIAEGRFEEAYRFARDPNPMASICGRVCAHPCETACRRGEIDNPLRSVLSSDFSPNGTVQNRNIPSMSMPAAPSPGSIFELQLSAPARLDFRPRMTLHSWATQSLFLKLPRCRAACSISVCPNIACLVTS